MVAGFLQDAAKRVEKYYQLSFGGSLIFGGLFLLQLKRLEIMVTYEKKLSN